MVKDIINNTIENIKLYKIKSKKDVYLCGKSLVCFSNKFSINDNEIKLFLKTKMYNNKKVLTKNNQGKRIIISLFKYFKKRSLDVSFTTRKSIINSTSEGIIVT